MIVGKGKLLDVTRLGENTWSYSIWVGDEELHELVISSRTHFEIIECEGEIVGREIRFMVDMDKKEMRLIFDDERRDKRETPEGD
jgi:hypothetical protein